MDSTDGVVLGAVSLAGFLGWATEWRKHNRGSNSTRHLIQRHLEGSIDKLVTHTHTYPVRALADLQLFLDRELPTQLRVVSQWGVVQPRYDSASVSHLVTDLRNSGGRVGPLTWAQLDVGGERPLPVLEGPTVYLVEVSGQPGVVLVAPKVTFGSAEGWQVSLAILPETAATDASPRFFAAIDAALTKAGSYRGKVLSLVAGGSCRSDEALTVRVHRLSTISRDQVILPETTLIALERNLIHHARHARSLAARGHTARKGVLLHGPPGTGKTHAIRWLSGALNSHTTFLITAEQIAHLSAYMAFARLLQPAVVVIEDADLVARRREEQRTPGTESLLNQLLNEMDGLRDDAEIIFILTTNRPAELEDAIASRPGRIDQAVLIPLPDAACRRLLLQLYGKDATLSEADTDYVIRRTEGVSAAFIKELMRRAALIAEMRQAAAPVLRADIDAAVEELLGVGGALSLRLLASGQAAANS